ncbi:class I SAM-dependent methyltransferase [Actinopolymorpha sp. B17G11]|uniref:class I SAM-dependent methyltransferase n=1 Tax=Actinopolymorpha sp. B17G11 TaxID=3160861 RepID=UPI0032E3926E
MNLSPAGPNSAYADVIQGLRTSYDGGAESRDSDTKSAWKVAERAGFLGRLREQECRRLLEIGAGTGQDSLFFAENGLDVVATDLSPAMVARCVAKGIDARVRDFLGLGEEFPPESFDAIYALNCLLHVPHADLSAVLAVIRSVLRPGGLFFLGVYGGQSEEGLARSDHHDPPRFFCFRTDEELQRESAREFEIVDFHAMAIPDGRFQSLTLRRPE